MVYVYERYTASAKHSHQHPLIRGRRSWCLHSLPLKIAVRVDQTAHIEETFTPCRNLPHSALQYASMGCST